MLLYTLKLSVNLYKTDIINHQSSCAKLSLICLHHLSLSLFYLLGLCPRATRASNNICKHIYIRFEKITYILYTKLFCYFSIFYKVDNNWII